MEEYRACPFCNKKIMEGLPFCPHCGKHINITFSDSDLEKKPYDILQVSENAEDEVIEAAYKSLARKYHPDIVGTKESNERMKDINWAHEILKDKSKHSEWKRKQRQRKEKKTSVAEGTHKPSPQASRKSPSSVRSSSKVGKTPLDEKDYQRQEKPRKQVQNVGPFGSLFLIAMVLVPIIIGLASMHDQPQPSMSASSSSQIENNTSITLTKSAPTSTRRPSPTLTPDPKDICLRWDQVNDAHVESRNCVYGTIVKYCDSPPYKQIIRFSDEAGTFLLRAKYKYVNGIQRGECIHVKGMIIKTAGYLCIDLDDPTTEVSYTSSYCR